MPLYEFQCDQCAHRFERIQKSFSDPPPDKCPKCAGTVRKLPSSPAIQFKGTGWYITDYAKKPSTDAGKSGGDSSGSSGSSDSSAPAPASADAAAKTEKPAAPKESPKDSGSQGSGSKGSKEKSSSE